MILSLNLSIQAAQYLPLPDGSSVTVRDGETPKETWARAQRMYPEAFKTSIPNEKKYDVDYYNDCLLKNTKDQTSNATIALAMQACEHKAIPKKCREFQIELSPTGFESGDKRIQCVEECKKSNYLSNAVGECRKG